MTGAALAVGPVLWRRPGRAALVPAGRHLAFGTDPRRTMVVSWLTPEPVRTPVVDVGTGTSYGRTVAADTRVAPGNPTRYHHAVVDGLDPGATYNYRVRHNGGTSVNATFRTAPASGEAFTFTAFGDHGVSATAAAMTWLVAQLDPAFHLHAGDLCYANWSGQGDGDRPDGGAVWDRWFDQIRSVAATRPWIPAVGNHEIEPDAGRHGYRGLLARFAIPAGGPTPVVHGFRYAGLAVLSLDTNDVSTEQTSNTGYSGGAQDAWLRTTLAGLRADPAIDFVVAQFHHCAYCSNAVHASDGGVRTHWRSLLDEFAVDLVINGHNHCYERTHPMRAGLPTTVVPPGGTARPALDGTTYVTAGGGGQTSYPTFLPVSFVTEAGGERRPELPTWSAVRDPGNSVLVLTVTPGDPARPARLDVRAVRPDGSVVDAFRLERPRRSIVA